MGLKRLIIIISITIIIMIGFMLGISYGWYQYKNAQTIVEGSTIKNIPTIIFTETEYIYSNKNMPINDEDRYNYAYKNSFAITIGENLKNYETAIEISLKDIIMSPELKSPSYKYELIENGVAISSGNFSNLGQSTTLTLKPMTIVTVTTYPQTNIYELYIWLSEDQTNQNNLMNKTFSAKINVNSAVKK